MLPGQGSFVDAFLVSLYNNFRKWFVSGIDKVLRTAAEIGECQLLGVDAHVVIERREDVAVVDGAVVGLVAVERGVKRVGND